MPVTVLLVEGELDAQIVNALLQDRMPGSAPLVEQGGSKGSLAPKCRDRRKNTPDTYYLRDRDFDFDPSTHERLEPMPGDLGWRWSRHEIESYLLDPGLASRALGSTKDTISAALVAGALEIREYQAARWVIGRIRRELPPSRELPTGATRALRLPDKLDTESIGLWLAERVGAFREKIVPLLDPAAVEASRTKALAEMPVFQSAQEALAWCSGKDLMAVVAPRLGFASEAPRLRTRLRDWVMEHPHDALELIPEWRDLLAVLA